MIVFRLGGKSVFLETKEITEVIRAYDELEVKYEDGSSEVYTGDLRNISLLEIICQAAKDGYDNGVRKERKEQLEYLKHLDNLISGRKQ